MIIRKLYNWILQQAHKPYAEFMLFFLALVEACLVPIPPDSLLIPMAIARRNRAFRLAAITTAGSVLGGLVGYGIGALAMETVGEWVVSTYNLQTAFDNFQHGFNKYGMWIILAKGLTPVPFILVTIASGVTKLNLGVFFFSCVVTRGARFFLEALLIHHFGAPIEKFIDKYLPWIALSALVAILIAVWLVAG